MAEQVNDKTENGADRPSPQQPQPAKAGQAAKPGAAQVQVRWDDSNMTTSYANVVNAASTREEVTLFFGTNQTWNVAGSGEVKVQLTNRIVVNPYAAKRLRMLLDGVLTEYEKRFGSLEIEGGNGAA